LPDLFNRVVQKLQFLNNNRLKITKNEDFVKKSSFFERLVSQAKLGKEPSGFLNKSNVFGVEGIHRLYGQFYFSGRELSLLIPNGLIQALHDTLVCTHFLSSISFKPCFSRTIILAISFRSVLDRLSFSFWVL
jgi:hypothetical protein